MSKRRSWEEAGCEVEPCGLANASEADRSFGSDDVTDASEVG